MLVKNCLAASALILLIVTFAAGQKRTEQSEEPTLLPLTRSEKVVDLRNLVATQPDFTATENYFSARDISGFSASSKVARRGKQYRADTGFVVVIQELGKPMLRLNGDRTYEEGVGNHRAYVSATSALNPTDLLGFDDIAFAALGAVEVNGARLLKIQAKSKHFAQEVYLYADLSRKNLITIVQIVGPTRRSVQRLEDVSFAVPDSLFDISGYKPLPKFTWTKVPNAKIKLRGEAIEDGVAFKHADYLFVHAGEFDHYFIDLRNKTALTVVYMGLLLSKEGAYIWRTKESEAISVGDLDNMIDRSPEYRVAIRTTANSVIIPDKKSQNLLTVEW